MSYTPEEIRAAGLDDFRVFLRQVWDYLGLPPPTPVQNEIAYYLQHGDRRLIVQAFRGVGKSWITVAYVLWRLFLNPEEKILVVSASGTLAEDWTKFAKQLIEGMPLLQHLKPRRGQRDKGTSFDVGPASPSKDPSVKAAGITGQITGTRADLIVPDDIEVPKNSFTHHLREKLADQVKEFDAILKPGGDIRYLGTPQVEASIYPKLARERGYKTMIWPSEIPEKPAVYSGNLGPLVQKMVRNGAKAGEPVDPRRFDKEDLGERRRSYGKTGYALQFMLDTNPSSIDRYPLKLRDLIVMSLDPKMGPVQIAWGADRDLVIEDLDAGGLDGDRYHRPAWKSDEMTPFAGTVMAIDPSGRGKDETAYAIVRFHHGMLYLVEVGGFTDGFAEATLQGLAAAAARHNVNYVIDEPNYGGGMFRQLLRPVLAEYEGKAGRFDDEWEEWSTGQKELRILDTLEPLLGSHRLVVDRRVIEKDLEVQQSGRSKYSLVQQMTRMERVRGALPHEDRLEAVAMACQYWVDKMGRNTKKEQQRRQQSLMDEELRQFAQQAYGRPSGAPRVRSR